MQISSHTLEVIALKSLLVNGLVLSILLSSNSSLLAQPKQSSHDNEMVSQSKNTVCNEPSKQADHQSKSPQDDSLQVQPPACLGLGQIDQNKTVIKKS